MSLRAVIRMHGNHRLDLQPQRSFCPVGPIYDSEDVAKMHAAVGVKSMYRGVSKEDPSKVCAVQQGPAGVAQKLFEDNKEMIRGAGHVIESTVISAYSDS